MPPPSARAANRRPPPPGFDHEAAYRRAEEERVGEYESGGYRRAETLGGSLGLTTIGTFIPGAGFLATGRRLIGGIVLGIAQSVGAALSPTWQILAGHLAFLVILIIRPSGLFPRTRD